jgi:hypothetical protein
MEKIKMKKLLTLIFLTALQLSLSAQSAGLSFVVGSPQNDFRTSNNNTSFGIQFEGSWPSTGKHNPFAIGITGGYQVFQTTDEARPFSLTIPDVWVDVERSHNLANLHLFLKISPFSGMVRPYFELLGGGSYLFTQTTIKSNDFDFDDDDFSDTNFDDFAWSYGGGGGLLIQVASDMGKVSGLFIDLKVRYLKGGEAEYLTAEDIFIDHRNHSVHYYPRKSETDLLSFNVGFVVQF